MVEDQQKIGVNIFCWLVFDVIFCIKFIVGGFLLSMIMLDWKIFFDCWDYYIFKVDFVDVLVKKIYFFVDVLCRVVVDMNWYV